MIRLELEGLLLLLMLFVAVVAQRDEQKEVERERLFVESLQDVQ